MRTLKLQLDYVLTRNILQSDIRESRALWDVAFDYYHHPVLLSLKIRFRKRNRGVPLQPKIDWQVWKTKNAERISPNVCLFKLQYGPGRNFAMRIPLQSASRMLLRKCPVQMPRKKFAFASAETRSTCNSVARSTDDFNQEKRP
ncbi:hypothetical protein RB195_019555 [Necator americanus]|uniref:FMP27 GFWDK domain-containing protein n=1 Tax=Necator americanus TaxID=51031 RepID=A0ABR1CIB1_NECAM